MQRGAGRTALSTPTPTPNFSQPSTFVQLILSMFIHNIIIIILVECVLVRCLKMPEYAPHSIYEVTVSYGVIIYRYVATV